MGENSVTTKTRNALDAAGWTLVAAYAANVLLGILVGLIYDHQIGFITGMYCFSGTMLACYFLIPDRFFSEDPISRRRVILRLVAGPFLLGLFWTGIFFLRA